MFNEIRFTLRGRSSEEFKPLRRAEFREGEGEDHRKERSEANPGVCRLQDVQDKDGKDREHCRQDSSDHGAGPVNLSLII